MFPARKFECLFFRYLPLLQLILLNHILCLLNKECNEMRAGIKRSQEKCHEMMLRASGKRFKPAEVGDAVVLPIPHPDRLCAIGPRNILGSIHGKQDDIYTIATSEGLISGGYSRNQFEIQSLNLITTPFSSTRIISQTELMQNASLGAGIGACKKCINRKCPCRNSNKNCSTKCHKGRMCSNKEQWSPVICSDVCSNVSNILSCLVTYTGKPPKAAPPSNGNL